MPTITDNMSEDGKSVEQRFIDILYNGGSAGELSGALGNLLRKMQHCDNLVQFIVGNGHGPAYVHVSTTASAEVLKILGTSSKISPIVLASIMSITT